MTSEDYPSGLRGKQKKEAESKEETLQEPDRAMGDHDTPYPYPNPFHEGGG